MNDELTFHSRPSHSSQRNVTVPHFCGRVDLFSSSLLCRARDHLFYIFFRILHISPTIYLLCYSFSTFFFNILFHTYYSRSPIINAQTFYHHITNQSPFFVGLLLVCKLLLVDLKLRCIRPDFDDFRSENVKSANHRPVFPSKLEYRPLIG